MALVFRSCLLMTPVLPIRSCLTFFQTHSSGLSSGEYAGQEEQPQPAVGGGDEPLRGPRSVGGVTVQDGVDRAGGVVQQLSAELG